MFAKTETFSKEDIEKKKKAIFDSMGKRAKNAILKKGYDNWNPFEAPNDPIDIRTDRTGKTVAEIASSFFEAFPEKKSNNAYKKTVEEMALGVVTNDDRIKARFAFTMWYKKVLEENGIDDFL